MERDQQTHAPQHQRIGEGESPAPEQVSQLRSALPPDGEERLQQQQAANNSPHVTQLRQLQHGVNGAPVKQLTSVRHKSKKNPVSEKTHGKKVQAIANRIDNLVQEAYFNALNWQNFSGVKKGYLFQWYKTALAYSQKPGELPDFLHARFGYAIETLVNQVLGSTNLSLDVQLQATHGHTRPDIVLCEKGMAPFNEVAWLDITSDASRGHIFAKNGGGWKNMPFVYEITYPALDPTKILTGSDDPMMNELGEYQGNRTKIFSEGLLTADQQMRTDLLKYKEKSNWNDGLGNQLQKRNEIRHHLKSNYHNSFNKEASVRGALDFLGLDRRPFGFHKSSNNKIKTHTGDYSAWRKSRAQTLKSLDFQLLDGNMVGALFTPIKKAYQKYNLSICGDWIKKSTNASNPGMVMDGIRIKGAIETGSSLQDSMNLLDPHKDKKTAVRVLDRANQYLQKFPKKVGEIVGWRQHVRTLEGQIPKVVNNLNALDEFQVYLINKEMDMKASPNNTEISLLNRLKKLPPDATAAQEARDHISNNPIIKKAPVVNNDVNMTDKNPPSNDNNGNNSMIFD